MKKFTILGIETSCDETAAAVYTTEQGMRSSVLFSQLHLHHAYGGVMPEIAARSHIEKIAPIVTQALEAAMCTLDDIDAIAVTYKPGLPGSLLVGLCFAKALAWSLNKPLIGVNHLEGHAFSACIEHTVPFPHVCLTASGGHTSLYIVHGYGDYETISHTLDDAAGEAFDKIAKLLDLGYPGGPIIEQLAQQANFVDYFQYPRNNPTMQHFSFSGLKTAVLYDLIARGICTPQATLILEPGAERTRIQQQVASSLLVCITDIFKQKIIKAFKHYPTIKALTFVGGVACNRYIRTELNVLAQRHGLDFFSPSPRYCTDNAGMIAFVGHYKAQQEQWAPLTLDILQD